MAFKHILGKDGGDRLARLESRIESLEAETLKFRTCDVHVRRFLTIEKELGSLIALKKKFSARTPAPDIKHIPDTALEKKQIEKMIEKTMDRYYHIIDNLQLRLHDSESAISRLEKENSDLKREISSLHSLLPNSTKEQHRPESPSSNDSKCPPPVIFQEFHIDRLIVDKYELTNNINQLGVKELSGQMNIGATYGGGIAPQDLAGSEEESADLADKQKDGEEQPPE
jgi:predicted RNase H-like nuclease (RuvC/YqgF family)